MLDFIQSALSTIYNVPEIIRLGGLVGLSAIVFAEIGRAHV